MYLLSGGMLICPECGGRFEGLNNGSYKYYVCATRRHAGKSVCANPLALRIDVMGRHGPGLIGEFFDSVAYVAVLRHRSAADRWRRA